MTTYTIELPEIEDSLFQCIGNKATSKKPVHCSVFEDSDYVVQPLFVCGNTTCVQILSPLGDYSKTMLLSRVLNNRNELVLDVDYYGYLDPPHVHALASCARKYGCETMMISPECTYEAL